MHRQRGYAARWVPVVLVAGACLSVAGPPPPAPDVRTTINRYCIGCHNQKLKTAGVALEGEQDIGAHADLWERVVRKLRTRSMPPAGLPRPDEPAYASALSTIETTLDTAAELRPNPGRTDTFRRLNRTEYRNAIRDLLALDIDAGALLPGDDASHGFDNVTVGELSPTLLERYVTAARKISRLAVGSPVRSPGGDTVTLPPDLTQEQHFEDLPIGTRGGRGCPIHVSSGCGIRNPAAADARPQRARRRADRAL